MRNKTGVNKICEVCNGTFYVPKCRSKASCCSRKCRAESMKGHRPFNYKGGRLTHHGYVYILKKDHPNRDRDGYVLEHRLVVEAHIGRYLKREEIVHHKNEIRNDNRIENLELVANQSLHMKEHYPKGMSFKMRGLIKK